VLASQQSAAHLEYWRTTLAGAPPVLALPEGWAGAAVAGATGQWAARTVPAATARRLREVAVEEGCTLFMVLLAGFNALLGQRAGTDDVVIGTPVAGRSHRELEELVGFFVNTLVLRTDLHGDPAFRELLGRVRRTTLAAFDHADVPFEKLVEVLKPDRSLAHTPLVQVLFALHNQPRAPLALDGLQVEVATLASETVKFDLNLHAAEEGDDLQLALAWRSGLYGEEAMNELLDSYVAVLQAVAADPGQALSRLVAAALPTRRPPPEAAPDIAAPVMDIAAELPAGAPELEARAGLLELWAVLLGRRDLGPDADFFAEGGHSLLATRLIAAIADRFGVELPLISVFEAPTIRGLARRIMARQGEAPPGLQAIRRQPRRPDQGAPP
jgi:non-ribosomal peptide synthetase component F